MKKRNLFKKVVAATLTAVMLVGTIPANTVVFATPSTSSYGTNTSVAILKSKSFRSTGATGPAHTEQQKVIYAITPYSLGSNSNSGGNVLNSYVIGTESGKTLTKNDLIYQKNAENTDEWGYILKNAEIHKDLSGKDVYTSIFFNKYNNSYIPLFRNSQSKLQEGSTTDNSKKTTLGEVTVTFNGYDNVSYPTQDQDPIYLMDTLYPEYKYSFMRHQQYWATTTSSVFNTQPLNKSSLLFVSGDLIGTYGFADYIWYTSNILSGMKGDYTVLGFDFDKSNVIYGKYTRANGAVVESAKPKAGLANGQSTNDVVAEYVSGSGKTAPSGDTLSTLFMKEQIKINTDGGVFYDWLDAQNIWTNNKDENGKLQLDKVFVDRYYYDYDSRSFKIDNKLDDLHTAFKKVSVGPQIHFGNLAKVPANLDALLKSNSTAAKDYTAEALKLWQYILYYSYYSNDGVQYSGDKITIMEKVNDFLRMGCYQTMKQYENAGNKMKIPTVDYTTDDFTVSYPASKTETLYDNLEDAFDEKGSWSGFNQGAIGKFEFLTNLYNAHYLDLLISAYVCAYNNNPTSEATKAWKEVLKNYCNPKENNWSANNCSIQITPVTITHGIVADEKIAKTVYTAAQDYVMLVYGIEEAGSVDGDSMTSLNRAFFGLDSNYTEKSVINEKTIKTTATDTAATNANMIELNEQSLWVYKTFYTKLKNCLALNLKYGNINSYNHIDKIQGPDHFGASGTVNRVFKYLFSVNNSTKKVTESLSKNPWGKLGGVIGSLSVKNAKQYNNNRSPIKDIDPIETVGNNLIIAFQWENTYQVTAPDNYMALSFEKKAGDITDKKKLIIDINKTVNESDDLGYTVQKDGSTMVVDLFTKTVLTSSVFEGKTTDAITSANLNLGTQAYVKEIRINGTKATSAERTKLLAAEGGLQLSGTGLDKGGRLYENTVTEDVLYDYIRKPNSSTLLTNTDWITEATSNRKEADVKAQADVGYFSSDKSNVFKIVNGDISVNKDVVDEKLAVSFGANFKPSTKYEIDIVYKRAAALGGEYENGTAIANVFNNRTSDEILLTLQYTPSTAEYRILGYDINTGNILGWTDKKDLTLGSETKEMFAGGKITLKDSVADKDYTIATASEALNDNRPAKLIYYPDNKITNYNDMLKKASSKAEVVQKVTGTDQTFTFTADKASSYTYLLVPIKLASTVKLSLNVYYNIKDGSVVYAEKVTETGASNTFKSEVTGLDGLLYKPVTNDEYLTDIYKYECVNPSANARLEINLMQLAAKISEATSQIVTFENMLDSIKANTARRIPHNLNITSYEWSVTNEGDKSITSMLWIPVDTTSSDVSTTVYYVDVKDPTKVLKTEKKADAKKGYAYTTNITTPIFADGMDYTVTNVEGYYTVTQTASKLKTYATAKALTSITVTNTDGTIKTATVPSTGINSMAIYVLMEGKEPVIKESYISKPEAFAELKEGTVGYDGASNTNIFNETFEAMAGVPSTETLYFTTGGSEFIVQLAIESMREKAERKYETLFHDTDCQFKETDSLNGGTTGTQITKQFSVNNTSGEKNNNYNRTDSMHMDVFTQVQTLPMEKIHTRRS